MDRTFTIVKHASSSASESSAAGRSSRRVHLAVSVLKASNAGSPVIMDAESQAGQAYADAVARFLGEEKPMRFIDMPKKPGLFGRLFGGGRAA